MLKAKTVGPTKGRPDLVNSQKRGEIQLCWLDPNPQITLIVQSKGERSRALGITMRGSHRIPCWPGKQPQRGSTRADHVGQRTYVAATWKKSRKGNIKTWYVRKKGFHFETYFSIFISKPNNLSLSLSLFSQVLIVIPNQPRRRSVVPGGANVFSVNQTPQKPKLQAQTPFIFVFFPNPNSKLIKCQPKQRSILAENKKNQTCKFETKSKARNTLINRGSDKL